MTAAAAALALVLAGGIVLQSISGGNNDDASFSAADAPSDDAPEPNSSAAIAEGAAEELQQDLESSGEVADGAEDNATNTEILYGDDTLGIDIDAEAPPKDADLEVLSTPEQLGIFASDAVGAPLSPDLPAAADAASDRAAEAESLSDAEQAIEAFEFPLCGGADYVVGPAEYRGEPVVVGIDESLDLALAYKALDCSIVARASLP
jgi:hypothetical protein